jgi:hypothetical protein
MVGGVTKMELTKFIDDKETLQRGYTKFMMEQDEVKQREGRLKKAVHEVYNNFLEIPIEIDVTLEEKVSNISESIQGFHVNIVDL